MNLTQILQRMSTGRAVMIGLILASFYYFLFMDQGVRQKSTLQQMQQQQALLQRQIQDNQAKLDRAAVYQKTAAEVGTTINKLLGVIPEKFNKADLEKIVSNEAKIAGSSLNNIEPMTSVISPVAREFEELSVKIDLSGSFLQHMIFLSNLTKINQILIIRKFNMDLAGQAKGDDSPTVKMSAEIVAYRYRGAEALNDKGNVKGR